jgi:hypothetical protein
MEGLVARVVPGRVEFRTTAKTMNSQSNLVFSNVRVHFPQLSAISPVAQLFRVAGVSLRILTIIILLPLLRSLLAWLHSSLSL